jgi:hypothetical protein
LSGLAVLGQAAMGLGFRSVDGRQCGQWTDEGSVRNGLHHRLCSTMNPANKLERRPSSRPGSEPTHHCCSASSEKSECRVHFSGFLKRHEAKNYSKGKFFNNLVKQQKNETKRAKRYKNNETKIRELWSRSYN